MVGTSARRENLTHSGPSEAFQPDIIQEEQRGCGAVSWPSAKPAAVNMDVVRYGNRRALLEGGWAALRKRFEMFEPTAVLPPATSDVSS